MVAFQRESTVHATNQPGIEWEMLGPSQGRPKQQLSTADSIWVLKQESKPALSQ